LGDKQSWLFSNQLHNNPATAPGDCVFQAIIDQLAGSRNATHLRVADMRDLTGLNRVTGTSLEEFAVIEEKLVLKGKSNRAKPHRIGLVAFDSRLNLRRLPPLPAKKDSHNKYYIYLVCYNRHPYAFRSDDVARTLMRRSISYFEAALMVRDWPRSCERYECTVPTCPQLFNSPTACNRHMEGEHKRERWERHPARHSYYEEAYELFRKTQHLQPDTRAIREYLEQKFAIDLSDAIHLTHVTHTQTLFVPWFRLAGLNGALVDWMMTDGSTMYYRQNPRRRMYPQTFRRAVDGVCRHQDYIASYTDFKRIKGIGEAISSIVEQAPWSSFRPRRTQQPQLYVRAKGLECRCDRLGIFKSDGRAQQRRMPEIKAMELTIPNVTYDMTHTICMDLETCSLQHTRGRFMVYAVRWRYLDQSTTLVARTREELHGGLMSHATTTIQRSIMEMTRASHPPK
jgi:hypothetical protein